jgi:retron-type reverse transcriptase
VDKEILQSKSKLLSELDINANYLFGDYNLRYETKVILRKNGSERTIRPPCQKLKDAQRNVLDNILNTVQLNDSVYGLSKDKGIKANAQAHIKNDESRLVNLDVTNFFPSINYRVVKQIFKGIGFNDDCASCLTKICTVDDCLPQGAPTSPYLSALAFKKIDGKIYNYSIKNNLTYTRYFDDLTLSGHNLSDNCIEYIEGIVSATHFELNSQKREVFEKEQSKLITGIVISKEGLDVSDEQKNRLKENYRLYVESNEVTYLNQFLGRLGFYLHINRDLAEVFYNQITGLTIKNKSRFF